MHSVESYDALRKEFEKFLLDGKNPMEGDDFLTSICSDLKSGKEALGYARKLKDEGNLFFKKGVIDDALENYGYAGVVLLQYNYDKDEDKLEFLDLVISILSNFTACLSRQNEFVLVGQICSVILDHSPSNVKAMFRRAKAAIQLREYDWAYWDLMMALQFEPNNREVNKELEEVKRNIKLDGDGDGEFPIGLGLGLSPPKKMSMSKVATKEGTKSHQLEEDCSIKNECKGNLEQESKGVKDELELPKLEMEIIKCPSINEDETLNEVKESAKDEVMGDATNPTNVENSYLTEPKCRFVNRRRSGSTLSISKQDYELLMRKKSIQYFSSRVGSLMTIRVVARPDDSIERKDTSHEKWKNEATKFDKTSVNEVAIENSKVSRDQRSESGKAKTTPYESKKRKAESETFSCKSVLFHQVYYGKMEARSKRKSNLRRNNTRSSILGRWNGKVSTALRNDSISTYPPCVCRFCSRKKRIKVNPHPSSCVCLRKIFSYESYFGPLDYCPSNSSVSVPPSPYMFCHNMNLCKGTQGNVHAKYGT